MNTPLEIKLDELRADLEDADWDARRAEEEMDDALWRKDQINGEIAEIEAQIEEEGAQDES